MGLFSSKPVRHSSRNPGKVPTVQTHSKMGNFGGKGKLVTGSKLSGGKSKRNPR
jgi:hypothetical protein